MGSQDKPSPKGGGNSQAIAGASLLGFVRRMERLDESIDELQQDKKEIYREAASTGFDKGVMKKLMRRRRLKEKNPDKMEEEDHLLDVYERAIQRAEEESM